MKKLLSISAMLMGVFMLTGCSNGPVASRDYDLTGFDSVDVGGAFDVEIVPDNSYSVTVTANENLFHSIRVNKTGETLNIDITGMYVNFGSTLKARVTLPELNGLKLSGATRATALGFKSTETFNLEVSGASKLDMDLKTGDFTADVSGASHIAGNLKAGDTRIELSGASKAKFDGSAGNTIVKASGASNADCSEMTIKDANIKLSGASHGSVNPEGRLDAELSGSSVLEYAGNPTLGNIDTSGSARIIHK